MKRGTKIGVGIAAAATLVGALLISQQEPVPLPLFVYEGETVLGHNVPPRLYVLVEQHAEKDKIKLTTPECNQYWFNWPCYVVVPRGEEIVRLHVFRCTDFRTVAKFDQLSCKNQRDYDQSFVR